MAKSAYSSSIPHGYDGVGSAGSSNTGPALVLNPQHAPPPPPSGAHLFLSSNNYSTVVAHPSDECLLEPIPPSQPVRHPIMDSTQNRPTLIENSGAALPYTRGGDIGAPIHSSTEWQYGSHHHQPPYYSSVSLDSTVSNPAPPQSTISSRDAEKEHLTSNHVTVSSDTHDSDEALDAGSTNHCPTTSSSTSSSSSQEFMMKELQKRVQALELELERTKQPSGQSSVEPQQSFTHYSPHATGVVGRPIQYNDLHHISPRHSGPQSYLPTAYYSQGTLHFH